MQRWQCSIHNGTLKCMICSRMNYISMFIILKTEAEFKEFEPGGLNLSCGSNFVVSN